MSSSGFELELGYTEKMRNSTSRVFADSVKFNVLLKAPTSILNPVFIINRNIKELDGLTDLSKYNYAYCAEFKRYYWINNIIYGTNSIVEVVCFCDVLATYQELITSKPFYVKYCGDITKANWLLDDERLAPEIEMPCQKVWNKWEDLFDEEGFVIFSCYGSTSFAESGVHVYATPVQNFIDLWKGLNGFWGKWGQIPTGQGLETVSYLVQTLAASNNCKDLILSARWLPLKYSTVTANATVRDHIYIGNVAVDFTGCEFSSKYPYWTGFTNKATALEFSVDDLGDVAGEDSDISIEAININFLKDPKYSSIVCTYPNGMQEINDGSWSNGAYFAVTMGLELLTGNYCMDIYSFDTSTYSKLKLGKKVYTISGTLGTDYMVHSQSDIPTQLGDSLRLGVGAGIAAGTAAVGAGLGLAGKEAAGALAAGNLAEAGIDNFDFGAWATSNVAKADLANTKRLAKAGTHQLIAYSGSIANFFSGKSAQVNSTMNLSHGGGVAGLLAGGTNAMLGTFTIGNAILFSTTSRVPAVIANKQYGAYIKRFGAPCGRILQLSGFAAADDPIYVECIGADIDPSTRGSKDIPTPTPDEIEAVNTALNTGLYIQR